MNSKGFLQVLGMGGLMLFLVASCVDDNLVKLAQKNPTDTTTAVIASTATATTTTTAATTTPAETGVSFSSNIQPILSKYKCANCHGSGYYNYSGVSSLAKSGQLYGTMSWSAGYRKMPPSQKASASELTLISTWISQGTLNN